ncbi:MAG: hypothetical protein HRU02_09590 [Myxococcales bacterium]|nr:hypothetical protein [Myxococcales bacterium]
MSGRSAGAALLLVVLAGLAPLAQGVVPQPERVAGAVADANRAAGRAQPLRIEVQLRVDGNPPSDGVLISYPAGSARLVVRDAAESVEIHQRQGSEYTIRRDGLPQPVFHRLLPPLFLLQADSGRSLRSELEGLGVDADALSLGRLDDRDCYVLGGRQDLHTVGLEGTRASLWSDLQTHEPVRVVTPDGVTYRLGPPMLFEPLRLPAWIEILEPGGFRAVLEVRGAAPTDAAPAWLLGDHEVPAPAAPRLPRPPLGGPGDRAISE